MKISPVGRFGSVIVATALATTPALSCPGFMFPWLNPYTTQISKLLEKSESETLTVEETKALDGFVRFVEAQLKNPDGFVTDQARSVYEKIKNS